MDDAPRASRYHWVVPNYELRLRGRLDPSWSAYFDGLEVVAIDEDQTVVRGEVVDQAALHGLLERIRDMSVELLSLQRLDL